MKHDLKNGDTFLGKMLDLNVLSRVISIVSSSPRTGNNYTAHQETFVFTQIEKPLPCLQTLTTGPYPEI